MNLRTLAIGIASIALIASPALAAPPPAGPAPAATAAHVKMTPEQRHDLMQRSQQKLKDLKLYTGAVDGKHNADFTKAVKDFQTAHKLKVSGHLNKETRQALGL